MKRASLVKAEKAKRELKNYGIVLIGALVLSMGYSLFIIPHNIVPGGVFGLSIVINDLVRIPVGMFALIVNIPILIWGTKMLGRRAGMKTLFFMIMTSVFVDLFALMIDERVMIKDILVSSIFGGLLIGLAVHIVKYAGATTGGSDIVARILTQKINIGFPQIILMMNIVVIILGVITFGDYTMTAYCLITIVVSTKTIGYFIKQSEQNKTVIIFSKNNDKIEAAISGDVKMKRDVVKMIHKDSNEKLILVTKGNKKLMMVEKMIYKVDPKANIVAMESHQHIA
jgi:uncharacterized membrane-anchored protein YitT (DUF2179 family)